MFAAVWRLSQTVVLTSELSSRIFNAFNVGGQGAASLGKNGDLVFRL
jgi:hypothetical protein